MNFLTTTWRQLVRRRLWPVALLLVAALAAVPVLLSRDAEPVIPPEPTASAPATEQTEKADATLAKPVVAKASTTDRARRRRVLGSRKDPFRPAPVKKAKKKKAVETKKPAEKKTETTTSAPTTSAPSTPTTPAAPVEPAKKPKVYAKDSLIVRWGDANADLKKSNLKKLGAIGNSTDDLLVYLHLTDHGKKAIFMVDASLTPTGDGTCKPHPSTCETIELAVGETEFFDVIDPETGDTTAQYELDLVDIK
jgi:hypothetical protein